MRKALGSENVVYAFITHFFNGNNVFACIEMLVKELGGTKSWWHVPVISALGR